MSNVLDIITVFTWQLVVVIAMFGIGAQFCATTNAKCPIWVAVAVGLCTALCIGGIGTLFGLFNLYTNIVLIVTGNVLALKNRALLQSLLIFKKYLIFIGLGLIIVTVTGMNIWDIGDDEMAYAPLVKSLLAEGTFSQTTSMRYGFGLGGQTIFQGFSYISGVWGAIGVPDAFFTFILMALALVENTKATTKSLRNLYIISVPILALPLFSWNTAPTIIGAILLIAILECSKGRHYFLTAVLITGLASLRTYWGAVGFTLFLVVQLSQYTKPRDLVGILQVSAYGAILSLPFCWQTYRAFGTPLTLLYTGNIIPSFINGASLDKSNGLVTIFNYGFQQHIFATICIAVGLATNKYNKAFCFVCAAATIVVLLGTSGLTLAYTNKYTLALVSAPIILFGIKNTNRTLPAIMLCICSLTWIPITLSTYGSALQQFTKAKFSTKESNITIFPYMNQLDIVIDSLPKNTVIANLTSFPKIGNYRSHKIRILDLPEAIKTIDISNEASFLATLKNIGADYLVFLNPELDIGYRGNRFQKLTEDTKAEAFSTWLKEEKRLTALINKLWANPKTYKQGIVGTIKL